MKTITMYELLGMVKDGKAPKIIKSEGHYYNYDELKKDYFEGMGYNYEYLLANTPVKGLDDKIEIIEDTPKEEKKIPEKLEYYDDSIAWVIDDVGQLSDVDKVIIDKLNDVIDYLKSKGE